jgi:ABC-type multidrug transport system ATPase subunit
MLANRVAIIAGGKVVAQDELRNLLTLDRELYSITFEADGVIPDYLACVERLGNVVKASIPKERLYDFMDFTRISALPVHDCSLKKISLEDSFFKIIKGEGSQV